MLLDDSPVDFLNSVSQGNGTEAVPEIDVFLSVHIPDTASISPLDQDRIGIFIDDSKVYLGKFFSVPVVPPFQKIKVLGI